MVLDTASPTEGIANPGNGVVALKDCIRVLNGFGHSLEAILPKLRDGFVAPDTDTARRLALEYPAGLLPLAHRRNLS